MFAAINFDDEPCGWEIEVDVPSEDFKLAMEREVVESPVS